MKKILFGLAILACSKVSAESAPSDDLFNTLKSLDSVIFTAGFNQCDTSKIVDLFTEDLEFYHDKGGVTFGRDAFIQSVENNICKSEYKPNRHLVEESLEVHPLYENGTLYGAIQQGEHQFSDLQAGKRVKQGKAQFTHLWILNDGKWQIKRVLSYDHLPIEQ